MIEARNQIAFEQLGLGSILRRYQLEVPPNQRDYAWGKTQVTQLFQDFSKAIGDSQSNYFLGTIVTIPKDSGKLEVVDGQQRLATTAILLAAIRDYLRGKEDVIVQSIDNDFLTGIDREERVRTPRLRLNIGDNNLFDWIIARNSEDQPEAIQESHKRLINAHRHAKDHVEKVVASLDAKDHGDLLNRWISFVEHHALVVLLKVPNNADAYKMFETLNDRGLRTTQADLIKNFLFGRSGDRMDEVQQRWTYVSGTLECLDEEDIIVDFLRHAITVVYGFVRESEVYDTVQNNVRGKPDAVSLIVELENLANVYVAISNPQDERWNGYPNSVRKAVEVFKLLDIRPMRPLLLAVAAKFAPQEAQRAFEFLISLGVRLFITGSTRSGSTEERLAAAANKVFDEGIGDTSSLAHHIKEITPSDKVFCSSFETAKVPKGKLARYYLRSLEMAVKDEAEPWFLPNDDSSVINLEHVLPKKPEESWPQFSEDELKLYVNRLGNQVLLRASDNSIQGNAPFTEKKLVFAESPYVLTGEVGQFDEWTSDSIFNRQQRLAELALKAWPIST